ncbi:aminodeoxychorismate synthase component I [Zavarzinia compransoris]|uniref:aminodeoxychorismate synthase component I n=1 Tax=Zavarzinia marina TaxID=2911065 RepID=UPI001F2B807F|nr:aminodeoxychorismate synthase component I [Zavarzinia marina]MCF4165561.1 aminodeoxychorismate synthase component I [Zavarzinia marina]
MAIFSLGPLDSMQAAARLAALPGFVFLDSALRHPRLGRFSYLTADPVGIFEVRDGGARWRGTAMAGAPLDVLRGLLARGRAATGDFAPFRGGAVGFLSYEAGRLFEVQPRFPDGPVPDMAFGLYDWLIAFDHATGEATLATGLFPDGPTDRADRIRALLSEPAPEIRPAPRLDWRAEVSAGDYRAAVARVIEAILAGDLFQANIAQGFTAPWPADGDLLSLHRVLRAANPGDFAACLDLCGIGVVSTSPECFVTVADGRVETRPIKGTIARDPDPAADAARAERLAASVKDRAENVMIVDLLRNDLSRVCRPGTVAVPELCAIETYAGLHHMVSAVTGALSPGRDALDLLAAAFPGGSITGAPKPEAMRLIAEIEGRPRGVYCGSIGWLGFDGSAGFNIAIRTVEIADGTARFRAGGGITALSDPAAEYRETLTKSERVLSATGRR